MKKIGLILGIIVLAFILLTYISISSTRKENKTSSIVLNIEDLKSIDFSRIDSVLVAPSTLYKANAVKKMMQGQQYREAWSTPVKFPVLHLDTLLGGAEILKKGGGKQTHSLKLETESGYIYTLRSINKDPEPLVPEWARTLGLENIIVDGISAQHPYAALAVAKLAEKSNLLHTDPKAVFLPEQNALEKLNKDYGNKIYLLEHETDGGKNWTHYKNVKAILDTEDLQELKKDTGPLLNIDKSTLIRARLFDIIIGDWDRHSKQWGWVVTQNETEYIAIPLAGDRDNAFFSVDGIIPSIISNKHVLPDLQSFKEEIDYLPGLVMPFDIYFLKNTPREYFIKEAKLLQGLLSNLAIEESFKAWQPFLVELDGERIIKAIQTRRDNLPQIANDFYEIIENRDYLTEPLKGSEDLELPSSLIGCFDCF
ncbi:hypothetical protein DZC72_07790 [Maribacter algicola]|uniref:Uncharacterized protein n=1 Tax=Maribacter algicola TaxID=2498892 RepID=A0A426RN83_9FLAO|nr:hypothetical protein [Maribacter algicola]RRQ50440.1 hypothetical protein DZC72_07790 [Maribacter algicola]